MFHVKQAVLNALPVFKAAKSVRWDIILIQLNPASPAKKGVDIALIQMIV